MNNTQKFLLDALNASLNKKKIDLGNTDASELFVVARAHNLAPIAYSAIKKSSVDDSQAEVFKMLEDSFYDAIARYDTQGAVLDELCNLLTNAKIRFVLFKGSQIKELYPTPELRLMGDIDVLIDEKSRSDVKSVLCQNGFELINSNGPVWDYRKNDVLIEVHTKIISGKVGSSNAEGYFENAINYAIFDGYKGYLEPSYHFEYLLCHIAHHFWFYGAGVKLILDLAIMQKAFEIDVDKCIDDLGRIGLDQFARVVLSVCKKWFGVGKDYDIDTRDTEEFLISFGAFGNLNRNKAAVVQRKALEEGKKGKAATKLSLLFPSYKKMKNIPYLKFMENRPYLIVYGWIYRIFYNLKNRKEFLNDAISGLGTDEVVGKAQEELQYFEEIGLL